MKSEISGEEIRKFCQSFRLTPRETEVVEILADGVVRIKDVAERLSLSPNTVNNHVNSIFLKTKTRAKSELLAMLLHRISEDLHWFRFLAKWPRVLCALRDSNESSSLTDFLERRHFRVSSMSAANYINDPKAAIDKYRPHFLLLEVDSLGSCDVQVDLARKFGVNEVFVVTDHPTPEERACTLAKAAEILVKPLNHEIVLRHLLSHYIDEDVERMKLLRMSDGADVPMMISGRSQLRIPLQRWGRGGVFLTHTEVQQTFTSPLQAGDQIEFDAYVLGTGVDQKPIKAKGQVSWVRQETQDGRVAGAGVRVLSLDVDDELKKHFSNLRSNEAYIPAGFSL